MPLACAARAASSSTTCPAPSTASSAPRAPSARRDAGTGTAASAGEPPSIAASDSPKAWASSPRNSGRSSGSASAGAQRAAGSKTAAVSRMLADDVTFSVQMSLGPGHLNAAQREQDLAELRDGAPLDVLVVGGGITGAGVALDAATRGLRVALVERRDLAWGTSRWSSKLVHGGLRYLAQGAVGIAMESARERHVLLTRTAPHLVRPIVQALPLTPALGSR